MINAIRDEFAKKLANKPRGLSMEEFNDIVNMLIESVSSEDEQLFMRFNYWMGHPDLDSKIVCADTELVRFGVLSARPSQKSKKSDSKNSEPSMVPSLAFPNNLDRLFADNQTIPRTIKRRPDTVENHAKVSFLTIHQN